MGTIFEDHHIVAAWQSAGLSYDETLQMIRHHHEQYATYEQESALAYKRAANTWNRHKPGRTLALWAASVIGDENRMKMSVAAAGGTSLFPALMDKHGIIVPARYITTHAGPTWVLYSNMDTANSDQSFGIALLPANDLSLARHQYVEVQQLRPAEVISRETHTVRAHPTVIPADGFHVNANAPVFHSAPATNVPTR